MPTNSSEAEQFCRAQLAIRISKGRGCDTALASCLGLDGDKHGGHSGERLQESLIKVSGFPAPKSKTDRFSEIA